MYLCAGLGRGLIIRENSDLASMELPHFGHCSGGYERQMTTHRDIIRLLEKHRNEMERFGVRSLILYGTLYAVRRQHLSRCEVY